jgi:iron complex transport system substrate-binding protein
VSDAPSEEGYRRIHERSSSERSILMSRRSMTLIAGLALVVSACGSSSATAEAPPPAEGRVATTAPVVTTQAATTASETPTSTAAVDGEATAFPVTVETANGSVTIPARPEHIVSLSPTSTEVLFAVGAGEEVVAVDSQSNYPEEAPTTDLTGLEPNLEAIAGLDADLVVLMYDPGEVVAGLEALGIPVIVHPAAWTLEDAYAQIEQIGVATGNADRASELVESLRSDIAAIAGTTNGAGATYYHELSPDYYSVTSATFVGSLYEMLGLANIADGADPDGFGYPQLSAEHILAEDPSLIFLADTKCCDQDSETIAQRPGWDVLSAVRDGAITELDDDVASRWGPRVVDLFEAIAVAVDGR